MPKKKSANVQVILQGARLSFPSLFEPKAFSPKQDAKYQATFLVDKGGAEHKKLSAAINEVIKEAWGSKPKDLLGICLGDGAEKSKHEGYDETVVFVRASAPADRRPLLVDSQKRVQTTDTGMFYPGCRVNAILTIWSQDNDFGKRVNASLDGVQFVRDDERLGRGGASPDMFPDADVRGEDDLLGGSSEAEEEEEVGADLL